MKSLLCFIAILSIVIYFGCSNNLVSPPLTSSQNSGQVTLKISSDSIPGNVVKVTAILTKTGEDSLTKSVIPLSNTSASIDFSNVPAGTWHLKVDAMDSDSVIVYTGETDIQVNAGIITQISLTLIPTGNGYGNIDISINWGQSTAKLTDYQNNPILSVKDIPYYTLAVDQAQVMYDNGKYKMWFMNLYDSGHGDISYAESNDGISWQVVSNGPVLTAGQPGSWDDYAVGMGYVLKDNGTYKLYYAGMQDPHTGMRQIGLATSTDGMHWQKYLNPVLPSDYNQYYLGVHSVLIINNVYYMYYEASSEFAYTFDINLATSTDGIHWTKYVNNPVVVPNDNWEEGSISYATIVKDGNQYKMTYGNNVQNAVGMAYSTDGIHWTKDASNPVFTLSDVSNGWCTKISYPFSVMAGNDYRIYYSGLGLYDDQYHLGVAFWK